jgi:hypothetical protein
LTIVFATQPHIDAIVTNLTDAAVDVQQLRNDGELLLLDARQTLATFMVTGQPDPDFFKASATRALEQLARGRTKTIRAYGEMVDVLWKDGRAAPRSNSRCGGTGSPTRTTSRCCAAMRWVSSTKTRASTMSAVTTRTWCPTAVRPPASRKRACRPGPSRSSRFPIPNP